MSQQQQRRRRSSISSLFSELSLLDESNNNYDFNIILKVFNGQNIRFFHINELSQQQKEYVLQQNPMNEYVFIQKDILQVLDLHERNSTMQDIFRGSVEHDPHQRNIRQIKIRDSQIITFNTIITYLKIKSRKKIATEFVLFLFNTLKLLEKREKQFLETQLDNYLSNIYFHEQRDEQQLANKVIESKQPYSVLYQNEQDNDLYYISSSQYKQLSKKGWKIIIQEQNGNGINFKDEFKKRMKQYQIIKHSKFTINQNITEDILKQIFKETCNNRLQEF